MGFESAGIEQKTVPLLSGPAPTAVEVDAIIATWFDLTEVRRRDLRSAVSRTVRICGLPAGNVIFEPAFLNPRLFKHSPAGLGITSKRFSDIVSQLRFILRRLDRHAPAQYPLSSAWRALHKALPSYRQESIVRFMRFCSFAGIEPSEVDNDTPGTFETWCRNSTLTDAIGKIVYRSTATWNWATKMTSGWPALRLAHQPRRVPYTRPLTEYSAEFQADVALFVKRISGSDARDVFSTNIFALDAKPRRRPAKPRTVETRLFQIRMAAAALVMSGLVSLKGLKSLRDLVEPIGNAQAIVMFFWDKAGRQAASQVAGIAELLRQIGKFHCELNDDKVALLTTWTANATPDHSGGLTPKNRGRLRALIKDRNRAMLLRLPRELMRKAGQSTQSSLEAARLALRAVVFEILIVCPLRIDNVRCLLVDDQLRRLSGATGEITDIFIDGGDVKNSEPVEWPLPPESAHLIQTFIDRYRPALADAGNPYLFPGQIPGRPMSMSAISAAINSTAWDRIGVKLNPHLMRHFAAWLYLKRHPGAYEAVRRILGHRDVQTTTNFYVGLEVEGFAVQFDDVVLGERAVTSQQARASFDRLRRGAVRPTTLSKP